jgi:hypothetical protein
MRNVDAYVIHPAKLPGDGFEAMVLRRITASLAS